MKLNKTLVLKFGGAAVAAPQNFSNIADIIIARAKEFEHIVVVVSAMGKTTDELIALAHAVNTAPPKRELDMLVSVGERISMSLLAMALSAKGIHALSFTGSQAGIITSNDHTEAKIVDVKPVRLCKHLAEGNIVIVAGYQGVSQQGEITTLGRGGTDTTAVALAVALGAGCVEFYKDVDGIFDKDPKQFSDAMLLEHLDYESALNIIRNGAKILQERSVLLAQKNKVTLHVLPFSRFLERKEAAGCSESLGTLIAAEVQDSIDLKSKYEV